MKFSAYERHEQNGDQGLPTQRPNRLRSFPGICGNTNANISLPGYEHIDWLSDNDAARMLLSSLLRKYFGTNVIEVVSQLFSQFSSLAQIFTAPAHALKSSLKGDYDALVALATIRNLQTHILHSRLSSQPYNNNEKCLFEYLFMRLSHETESGVYVLFLNKNQILLHDCYFEDDGHIAMSIYNSLMFEKASAIIIGYKQTKTTADCAHQKTDSSNNENISAQLECRKLRPYLSEQILLDGENCYRFGNQQFD